MVIYLDVLMAVNFLITYFSLKAAARLLHAGYSTRRLIAASVFGGISSLSAVIPLGFIKNSLDIPLGFVKMYVNILFIGWFVLFLRNKDFQLCFNWMIAKTN